MLCIVLYYRTIRFVWNFADFRRKIGFRDFEGQEMPF